MAKVLKACFVVWVFLYLMVFGLRMAGQMDFRLVYPEDLDKVINVSVESGIFLSRISLTYEVDNSQNEGRPKVCTKQYQKLWPMTFRNITWGHRYFD